MTIMLLPSLRLHLSCGQGVSVRVAINIGHVFVQAGGILWIIEIPDLVEETLPCCKNTILTWYSVASYIQYAE